MTAPTAMSREELIELAALDALGLLDEFEAALYTRAFLNAPETVQQELRDLQAQVTSDPALLSAETPDDSLRERVLATVNRAIETEDEKFAPIASIGRRHRLVDGDSEPRYRLLFAARFWRAACFALCGGLVVLSYFLAEQHRQTEVLARLALSDNTSQQINQLFGRTAKDYLFDLDRNATAVKFQATDPASDVRAMLLIYEDGKSMLITEGLDITGEQVYSLKMVDRRGTRHDIASFDNIGRLAGREVVAANHRMAVGWEIHGSDGVILTSVA